MGTNYVKTNYSYASLGTSRLVTIPTSPATQVLSTSGFVAMQIINLGPGTIAYGDANISASTGGLLFYSMDKTFADVKASFSTYVIADSIATKIMINEYRA